MLCVDDITELNFIDTGVRLAVVGKILYRLLLDIGLVLPLRSVIEEGLREDCSPAMDELLLICC